MRNIEFLNVAVGDLRKNPWNTNKVTPTNEAKIRASLERNGMFKPIIVRQVEGITGYEILGGEHRWEQAIQIGALEVPVANLGFISDKQAKEIGVIDNARYGVDDTLSFADLLKELGDVNELQDFLPYGSADLDAIFSSANIALDDLGFDEELNREEDEEEEVKPSKPVKTHNLMRMKISIGDSERLTALIAKTQKDHGYTTEDDLTNAGDALIHLLKDLLPASSTNTSPDAYSIDDVLDGALGNLEIEE